MRGSAPQAARTAGPLKLLTMPLWLLKLAGLDRADSGGGAAAQPAKGPPQQLPQACALLGAPTAHP